MNKLEILYEKYKFDYIYINPNDIDSIEWEYVPEELIDFVRVDEYLGTIKLNSVRPESGMTGSVSVMVFYDKKITSGEVIFKYKSIQKERNVKLSILRSKSN